MAIFRHCRNNYVWKEMMYILGRKKMIEGIVKSMNETELEYFLRRMDREIDLGLYDEYEAVYGRTGNE